MIGIVVTKLENAGSFLCKPLLEDAIELYTEFLANLNSHYLKSHSRYDNYVPKEGDICACLTAVGNADRLWYRGLIKKVFKSASGMIYHALLVDEGEVSCITKARLRRLPDQFLKLPHQVMSCVLDGLIPMTLNCNEDLMMALKKSNYWDKAATRYVESLTEDCDLSIDIVSQNIDGTKNVVLYSEKDNVSQNVNELLLEKQYATYTVQHLNKSTKTAEAKEGNEPASTASTQAHQSLSPLQLYQQQEIRRKTQKQTKQEQINNTASKECEELLKILEDDPYSTPPPSSSRGHSNVSNRTKCSPAISDSSQTSDPSDIESTPVPKTSSYKSSTNIDAAEFLMETCGRSNYDVLSKTLRMDEHQESSDQLTSQRSFKPFESIEEAGEKPPKVLKHLVDANFLLNAVAGGPIVKKKRQMVTTSDVLVSGKRKREPMTSVEQFKLPDPLGANLKFLGFKSQPTSFQMHMWPAVDALRNVVGIAEGSTNDTSKIIGYILPILRKLILDNNSYKEVGPGNGPFVLICVSSWREAQLVFDICGTLLGNYKKTIRLDIRYGGMDNEQKRNIRLLNGCEVLITTIPSLNDLIQNDYTNMERLCHVVFDSVDKLVELYTEEIKLMMRSYCAVLKANDKLKKINQLVAVGRKWTYGVQSLFQSYFEPDESLVIISNQVEVALYAKVPIVVEVCKSEDRLGHLLEFLETDGSNENSIVFTISAKTANILQQELLAHSISANVLTEFTTPAEARDVQLSWDGASTTKGMNVLMMSDQALKNTNIRNATFIIHYDFPKHKSVFGSRLMCMLDNIHENETAKTRKELLSYVLICEAHDAIRNSSGLVKLLKRSGQRIPALLESMALSSRELKEEAKQYSELCPRLKLFGNCSYIDDCTERHTIFPDKDLLGLCPSTGFVKVTILDVVSASCFWGRIIEHRLPFEGTPYDTNIYLTLGMDMNLHYGKQTNRKHCTDAEKYDICVVKTLQHGYQRVRIEEVTEMEMERPKKLEVFGIDNGFTLKVSFDELLICEDKFKYIPHQAIEIIACCVRPVEKGTSWTHEASYVMESRVKGKILEGRVKFSLQNTIWVDPLVEKELLEGMQTRTYTLDVARDLLSLKFAEKNTQHLENLRKLLYDVQGQTLDFKHSSQGLPMYMIDHEACYLADNDYEEVYVSSVVHPALFYVQRTEQIDTLDKLDAKIDATMKVKKTDTDLQKTTLPNGYICVAKFSVDEKWYRAKILGVNDDLFQYDIFFVDHGDREWISKNKVVPAWPDIISLPFQAIECSFTNITSRSCEWTSEDGDEVWDIVNGRLLVAKATSVGGSNYVDDMISYEIELFDTSGAININISHELVYCGAARGSLQCIQEMFPHARKKQEYKNEYDRCPDLCVDINQAETIDGKLQLAKKLKELFQHVKQNTSVLVDNGSLQSVCKLLALCRIGDVKETLLEALHIATSGCEKCCECVYNNNGLNIIHAIFTTTNSISLQKSALKTLKRFSTDIWYQETLVDFRMVKTLLVMINESNDDLLTGSVVELLGLLCVDNSTSNATVRQEDGIEVLCKLLSNTTSACVLDSCAKTFLILMSNERNRERIRECGGLQDLAFVCTKRMSDMTLYNFLSALYKSTEDNELNREYLHRITAHLKLKEHANQRVRYSLPVKKLFNDLITLLSPGPMANFISSHEIDQSFYEVEEKNEEKMRQPSPNKKKKEKSKKRKPTTYWSQQQTLITLSIDLRGVEQQESYVEKNRVYFRTFHNNVEYELDLELYDAVIEKECRVLVKGGEVLIVLKKENTQQEWPRLLKSETKFSNIRIDFDRWTDDEIPEYYLNDFPNKSNNNSDSKLFLPGLPPPPPCKPYTNAMPADMYNDGDDDAESSTGNDSDDDDDADHFYKNQAGDFFQI